MSTTSGAGNAPISNLDFLRSWWLAQQLQQQRGLSPHLWLQLQALQQAVNQRYRQQPLSMPTWPPALPPMTLQQRLPAFPQHNLPYTGSQLDMQPPHLPSLDQLAPLW